MSLTGEFPVTSIPESGFLKSRIGLWVLLARLGKIITEGADFTVGAGVDTIVAVVGALPTRKAAGLTQYSSQSLLEMLYQSLSETLKMTSRSHNAR